MPQKISAQNVFPRPKVQDFWKKLSLGVRSPWLLSKRRWENIAEYDYVYRINARFITSVGDQKQKLPTSLFLLLSKFEKRGDSLSLSSSICELLQQEQIVFGHRMM